MTLHAPQIIFLALTFLALGSSLAKHGEPKNGTYNFGTQLVAEIIIIGLLYWGGFFG
jgi:hypothetical protein